MKTPKPQVTHTSDIRKVERMWLLLGGRIEPVRRTGETRYRHAALVKPLTVNGRRNDVPAKLLTLLNRVSKQHAANDDFYTPHLPAKTAELGVKTTGTTLDKGVRPTLNAHGHA